MYNKDQIFALHTLTKDFLQHPDNIELAKLKDILKFHEYQYYVAS